MNQELLNNTNQQKVEEQTAAMNSSSSSGFFDERDTLAAACGFSKLTLSNHPPCAYCGCNGFSASSLSFGSHKRPPSENPTSAHPPKTKKSNHNNDSNHFLSAFSKIPLSPPPQENTPLLRRCLSDISVPPSAPPRSAKPNPETVCPDTLLPNTIASSKLPPRTTTLKRSASDPIPSPSKTGLSFCRSPDAEWFMKMRDCIKEMSRKWDELLGSEEDDENAEMNRITDNNPEDDNSNFKTDNRNNDAMENSEEGYTEAVCVEKKGEALILHFDCPCGVDYQIVLLDGSCYYKVT